MINENCVKVTICVFFMYDLIPYSPEYCDLSILVDSEKDTGNSHLHINSFSMF